MDFKSSLNVRLSDELYAQIVARAKKNDQTKGAIVRMVLAKEFKQRKTKTKKNRAN